jgi:ectoine hydroxylase-related dioxygenase (phytanoyl-CoA dioxygenase family)
MVSHPNILASLQKLWGPSIRFDVSKLNLKAAGYGAPVEWHQDWAFYPHTNDDLAAVGIMMDDLDEENGALMVIPGSHKGPVLDHHADGVFCGAMDPAKGEVNYGAAVPMTGPAGSITIHHVRTVHGSATNTSGRPRRLLLHQYRAADAWPLLGTPDFNQYRSLLLCGEDTLEPRMALVPVRLPLPPAEHQGSIYENQRAAGRRFFKTADELEPAVG